MEEKLLVIGSYPEQGETHSASTVGVASYTKNTLLSLPKTVAITVLAEELPGTLSSRAKRGDLFQEIASSQAPRNDKREYTEDNITIKRIWKRNSPFTFPTLLEEILINQKDSKKIIIPLELAMFGNFLNLALLPFFILVLRLLGKEVICIFHHVIADIRKLSGHIYTYQGTQAALLNIMIALFYRLVMLTISKAIVMEDSLAKRLSQFGNVKKIVVIPHGVEDFNNGTIEQSNNAGSKKAKIITKDEARKRLGIQKNAFVLLYFGYLAYYKGADWLVNQISNFKFQISNLQLVMAGGPNPNHMKNKAYREYVNSLYSQCHPELARPERSRRVSGSNYPTDEMPKRVRHDTENSILITGFVPQEKIPLYFKASDVAIFPYRTFMSASGPLSMAFSFHTPFLVSKAINGVFKMHDIEKVMKKENLKTGDLTFDLNGDFVGKIEALRKDLALLLRIKRATIAISKARSFEKIGKLYYDELFGS